MNVTAIILVALHVLTAVFWVGGMIFAHAMLRPAAIETLPTETRLKLWRGVLGRFLPRVWVNIAVLLASGLGLIFYVFGGFAGIGLYVHLMMGLGIVMFLLFGHLYFAPWRRFTRRLDAGDQTGAGAALGQIRQIVVINMVLGIIVVVVGATGRWWGV